MHMKKKDNWRIILTWLTVMLIAAAFLCLTGCDEDEEEKGPQGAAASSEELLPVFPDIVFSGEAEQGDEITEDMIPPGGLVPVEDDGTLDPDARYVVSKSARAIRRIVKQDVYGRQLNDEFYYYRGTLSSAEQQLYDQIYANCIEVDPSFNIQSRVSHTRAMHVLSSVLFDNPDLFWVEPAISYSYGNDGYIIAVTLKFYDCSRNLDAFKRVFYDCADSVLEHAMKLENDVLKVKYIHDVLTYINVYDGSSAMNQSAYSAIAGGKTVCAGYAAAFTYYMQRLGIPSIILEGYAGENHAWNIVKLYGEYYEMDVTWDDPLNNPSNKYYYNYFNITTNEINKERYRNRVSATNVPIANGTRYSYPTFFGYKPGSDFSSLKYGKPSVTLPHVYPGLGTTPAATTPAQTAATPSTQATTPQAATGTQQPQITIVNNTGYAILGMYISPSTDNSWGSDKLGATEWLRNGQSYTVKLPFTINSVNEYDIMLEDSDEDTYTRMNVRVTDNARIVFTFDDYDG